MQSIGSCKLHTVMKTQRQSNFTCLQTQYTQARITVYITSDFERCFMPQSSLLIIFFFSMDNTGVRSKKLRHKTDCMQSDFRYRTRANQKGNLFSLLLQNLYPHSTCEGYLYKVGQVFLTDLRFSSGHCVSVHLCFCFMDIVLHSCKARCIVIFNNRIEELLGL